MKDPPEDLGDLSGVEPPPPPIRFEPNEDGTGWYVVEIDTGEKLGWVTQPNPDETVIPLKD
jgi:hypothetical protein